MPVYDQEKDTIGNQYDDDAMRRATGIDPADEKAMEARAHDSPKSLSPEQLNEQEQQPADSASKTASSEAESRFSEDDHQGALDLYAQKNQGNLRGKFTKRQIFGGSIAGLLVGIILGIGGILSGPLQIVHFSQLLQDFHFQDDQNFMDSRVGQFIRYSTTTDDTSKRNLGAIGETVSSLYRSRLSGVGIAFTTDPTTRRITSLEVDSNTSQGKQAISDLQQKGYAVDLDGNGKTTIPLDGLSARQRRIALSASVDTLGLSKISSLIAKRTLKKRAGIDLHPFKNLVRAADESALEYSRRVKEERDQRRRNGVESGTPNTRNDTNDTDVVRDEDGNIIKDNERNTAQADMDATQEVLGDLGDGDIETKANKLTSRLAPGVGAVGVVSLVCGVYQLLDTAYLIKESRLVQPAIRVGAEVIASGEQIRAADGLNSDEVGVLVRDFTDSDGYSVFDAASVRAEKGQNFNPALDLPEGSKPGQGTPPLFTTIEGFMEAYGGAAVCGAVTSVVGAALLDGVGYALSFTGPISLALNVGVDVAIGVGTSIFMQDIVRWITGEQTDFGATGYLLGSLANVGTKLMSNEAVLAHGGAILSSSDVISLENERNELNDYKQQNMSFFAKYLDIYNPYSLASVALVQNSSFNNVSSVTNSLSNITTIPLNSLGSFSSSFLSVLSPTASAQRSEYEYSFATYGFSLADQELDYIQDPFANANYVEPRLEEFNSKWGRDDDGQPICFGTIINPQTFSLDSGETTVPYSEMPDYCDPSNLSGQELEDFNRYRFYLADMTAVKTMSCYEGLSENDCLELGFEEDSTETTSSNNSGVINAGEDTSSQICPQGTTDAGIFQDYGPGGVATIKIRVCDIPGFSEPKRGVNVSIATQALEMIEAMRADGLSPAGNGFRSYDAQVALRVQNCPDPENSPSSACNPDTAKAGNSMHEVGLALDFKNMSCGATCPPGTNDRYDWLVANAGDYGFSKLGTESWHWSINGK